jgi:hypothetical protein
MSEEHERQTGEEPAGAGDEDLSTSDETSGNAEDLNVVITEEVVITEGGTRIEITTIEVGEMGGPQGVADAGVGTGGGDVPGGIDDAGDVLYGRAAGVSGGGGDVPGDDGDDAALAFGVGGGGGDIP